MVKNLKLKQKTHLSKKLKIFYLKVLAKKEKK